MGYFKIRSLWPKKNIRVPKAYVLESTLFDVIELNFKLITVNDPPTAKHQNCPYPNKSIKSPDTQYLKQVS